ncbi:hypothetical protein EXIGLDRAFT_437400 [Exidia glandulosa HHB12029]|uniref:Uncharacterized protein n=1 Tax=Exidia glandulosa HHB12029 TaxID=1314781 RepID=A0A165Z764_EXIGL|nr:hypothetical protein EXIGLDRAFT_437400 [Exidia glandulosa HHB12029]
MQRQGMPLKNNSGEKVPLVSSPVALVSSPPPSDSCAPRYARLCFRHSPQHSELGTRRLGQRPQAKLDSFYSWCCSVFLRINKLKSWWMPLSSIPRVLPVFKLGGELVPVKETEFYVGMKLSASRNIFAQHSQYKADTAFTISSIMFASIDKRCVQFPPVTSCRLYKTIIDPHLTHGCDVSPDATKSSTDGLEWTQHIYLRKALRVGKKTTTVALFTETGIAPVRYRRADLLVRFLGYLLQRPRTDLVACALRDSLDLAAAGCASWALGCVEELTTSTCSGRSPRGERCVGHWRS